MLRVADLAVQLAIGEGARSPFTELGIRLRVEPLGATPEAKGLQGPLLDRLPPFQQQRAKTHLR